LCVYGAQWLSAAPAAHTISESRAPEQGRVDLTGRIEILDKDKKHSPGANSVVWIPGLTPSASGAATPSVASQDKHFVPHVLAVSTGADVSFPNLDPIFHNVFSLTPENKFDLGLYRKGAAKSVRMGAPALVRIYCNIHSDMAAFVMVLDRAAFTLTDADGNYRLPAIPAGQYNVYSWNERTGEQIQKVAIDPASGAARLDFLLDASTYKPQAHKNKFGREYPPVSKDVDRY
jgi:plastocyanin